MLMALGSIPNTAKKKSAKLLALCSNIAKEINTN
jgi:hypothetical protein